MHIKYVLSNFYVQILKDRNDSHFKGQKIEYRSELLMFICRKEVLISVFNEKVFWEISSPFLHLFCKQTHMQISLVQMKS